MTDREKLEYIRIYCNGVRSWFDGDIKPDVTITDIYNMLNAINSIMDKTQYQPSGRACFDKPPGVPIYHWETEE